MGHCGATPVGGARQAPLQSASRRRLGSRIRGHHLGRQERHRRDSPRIGVTRPGGSVGYVGLSHGVELDAADLFFRHVRLLGGPAPVRCYLPNLIDRVLKGEMNPGKVFDLTLPLR